MLNRWAHVFLCILRLHSQFPPVGGSALTRPAPFGGPPRREGPGRGVVPVMLPAAWAPHPGARLPAAWWAFDRRYRPFLPYRRAPPYQCLSVRRPVSGTVRSSAAAVPHPISAFVRSQSPRGEAAGGTVCSCPTAPPRPISASACFVIPAVPSVLRRPPCPTLSVLSFGLLSAAVGRRGFRSSCEASSHNARNRGKGSLACVGLARSVVPVHSIDRCTCVASFTAGACARASERLTPPLSDGGQ